MQLASQVNDLQIEVLNEIELDSDIHSYDYKTELPEFVFVLLGISAPVAELALGKVGKKLVEFINAIDLDHPDLPYVVDNIFQDINCRQQVQEVLEVADKCKHLSSISSNFPKLINRHGFSKHFLQATHYSPRLWKSKRELNAVRKNRKMQNVDLKSLHKKPNIWNRLPDDFKTYNRNNIPHLQEIEESERKLDRYIDLGCADIADKITKEIRQFRINLSYRYCGFNKVTMMAASAILARMHGYKLKTSWDIHDNQTVSIIIPNQLLYDFQPDDSELPSVFIPRSLNGDYEYEARVYPVCQMFSTASEEMVKLIDHFDNFPDINGKVLFDDLLVLVPSVKLYGYSGTYFIKDKKGNILGFDSEQEAAAFLDKKLIESGSVYPVLLGERDSMCYFISYWR